MSNTKATSDIKPLGSNQFGEDEIEEEEEEGDPNSKEIQAGKGTFGPDSKTCVKPKEKEKKPAEKCEEEPIVVNTEKGCTSHSFCIVKNLKHQGVYPIQPKGFPWASGRLLYLPGQRPKHYDLTPEELAAIKKGKKKKMKAIKKEKQKMMEKLRHGDHVKLCDVMNTTQELMLLMRTITMVMEKKKIERRKILALMQTEESIPEEGEMEGESAVEIKNFASEEMEEIESENEGVLNE